MLIALLMLKCRAAFIGVVISTIVFYSLEYNFMNWVKNKKNKTTARALIVLSIIIVIPLGMHLYNAKKASSEGRKFIWKVSVDLAVQKPFYGYGYGYFQKEYNLYQADYIQQGRATNEELKNAGPVIMPHNELLHHLVQGGVVGLMLVGCFFGALLFSKKEQLVNGTPRKSLPKKKNRYFNVSYAGVVTFIGISMINSTIEIVSIMALLIIYAAMITNVSAPVKLSLLPTLPANQTISVLLRTTAFVLSLYVFCNILLTARADRENKIASILEKEKHVKKALQIMPHLEYTLGQDPNYWKNYALLHFRDQNYPQAITCFDKAKKWSSLPDLYLATGLCYEKLHKYVQAIDQYNQLVSLLPSKFGYRFRLMNAYLKNKDTINTIAVGEGILELEPKIPSLQVEQCKKATLNLLKRLKVRKDIHVRNANEPLVLNSSELKFNKN
jgi:tetratricopeptide (TPR) repeat protein